MKKIKSDLEFDLQNGIDFSTREIRINREINKETFSIVSFALSKMEQAGNAPITIIINSNGGLIYETLAIIGRMLVSPCEINTFCFGKAFSAALILLSCGKKRYMSSFAMGMAHTISYSVDGNHIQNKNELQQADKDVHQLCKVLAENSKKPYKFWKNLFNKNVDTYLSPQTLLKYGVIDRVV